MAAVDLLAATSATGRRSAASLRGATQRIPLKSSRCATRSLFSAIKGITEHFCHGRFPPKKMHLETVRLFLGAGFRINAPDVWFRIRIWSFSHGVCLTTTPIGVRINESMQTQRPGIFSDGGKFQARHFASYSAAGNSA